MSYAALPWIGVVVSLLALGLTLTSWSMEGSSAEPATP